MDEGSVFCDEHRNVLGRVLDVFGQVAEPCYAVRRVGHPGAAAAVGAAASSHPGEPPPSGNAGTPGAAVAAPALQVGMHVYAVTALSAAVDLGALRTATTARDFELEVEGEDVEDEDEDDAVVVAAQPGQPGRVSENGSAVGVARAPGRAAGEAPRHGRGGRRGCREADGFGATNAESAMHAMGQGVGGRTRGRGRSSRGESRGRGPVKARRRGRGSDAAGPPGCAALPCVPSVLRMPVRLTLGRARVGVVRRAHGTLQGRLPPLLSSPLVSLASPQPQYSAAMRSCVQPCGGSIPAHPAARVPTCATPALAVCGSGVRGGPVGTPPEASCCGGELRSRACDHALAGHMLVGVRSERCAALQAALQRPRRQDAGANAIRGVPGGPRWPTDGAADRRAAGRHRRAACRVRQPAWATAAGDGLREAPAAGRAAAAACHPRMDPCT